MKPLDFQIFFDNSYRYCVFIQLCEILRNVRGKKGCGTSDEDCTERAGWVFKKSILIGYVNKLRSLFRH